MRLSNMPTPAYTTFPSECTTLVPASRIATIAETTGEEPVKLFSSKVSMVIVVDKSFIFKLSSLIALIDAARMVVAVSYTHLRAHETRHDLVCRLLLEK